MSDEVEAEETPRGWVARNDGIASWAPTREAADSGTVKPSIQLLTRLAARRQPPTDASPDLPSQPEQPSLRHPVAAPASASPRGPSRA